MKNFLVHLSMSLGYTINPELWFKTNHFKLKRDHRPQDLLTTDIFQMIDELHLNGYISKSIATEANDILNDYSEIDLKKVLVRAIDNNNNKRDVPLVNEDHDHDVDLENAIELFQKYKSKRYQ